MVLIGVGGGCIIEVSRVIANRDMYVSTRDTVFEIKDFGLLCKSQFKSAS